MNRPKHNNQIASPQIFTHPFAYTILYDYSSWYSIKMTVSLAYKKKATERETKSREGGETEKEKQ